MRLKREITGRSKIANERIESREIRIVRKNAGEFVQQRILAGVGKEAGRHHYLRHYRATKRIPYASLNAHNAAPVSSRAITLRPLVIPKKNEETQHGVKALDGGDADAADAVELRGLQVLDVVKLGELAAVVGRDELLEFFQGLVAEVAAVDEEEDAARAGELDEAVNEVDGGVGLAAAGGHLDEGAAFVGGEGFLEVADGFDLRGPEITLGI